MCIIILYSEEFLESLISQSKRK